MSSYKICDYCGEYEHDCKCLAAKRIAKLEKDRDSLKLSLEAMTKERDDLQKAYLTVKGWAHRLEYKLIALMDKCEEAAAEEPAGSFPDNLIAMMNELDVNNCDTAKLLELLESTRNENAKMREALKLISTCYQEIECQRIARKALSTTPPTTGGNSKEGK